MLTGIRRRYASAFALSIIVITAACGSSQTASLSSTYPSRPLRIMAPAHPGGGWDTTARAMQHALNAGITDQRVEVYNVGGAGGTIGLAQFVNSAGNDPHQLMVVGLVVLGAARTNNSALTLADVAPIATLTTEHEAVAVPADSPFQTLGDLIAAFRQDPRSISWGGGSAGGSDHMLVGLIAKAAGVDPAGINYIAHAGGGEALGAILSGAVTAGVAGVSEFASQVEAGRLRVLAVSSPDRITGIDAPTFREEGMDVELSNWRGVMGSADLTPEQRAQAIALIARMHASNAWQQSLTQHGWTDFFLTGDEFATFLEGESKRVERVLGEIGLLP